MSSVVITRVSTQDARFQLKPGEGVDAIHTNPQYAYAVARLHTDGPLTGVGLALTLGPRHRDGLQGDRDAGGTACRAARSKS